MRTSYSSPYLLPIALVAALGFTSQPKVHAQSTDGAPGRAARVIVKLRGDSPLLREQAFSITSRQMVRAKALGQRVGVAISATAGLSDSMQVVSAAGVTSEELAARLASEADVEYAVPDRRRRHFDAANDPLYPAGLGGAGPAVGQWYLRAPAGPVQSSLDIETAWSVTTGLPGIVVAVVDTGVRYDHPDLRAAASGGNLLSGYDMVADPQEANDGDGRDADASDPGDWVTDAEANNPSSPFYRCTAFDISTGRYAAENSSWHGTKVSSLVAALTNNGVGMASVGPNLKILPVRVLGKCFGYDSDILAGMRWAAGLSVPGVPLNPNRARVINLSLGGPGECSAAYRDAIGEIVASGSVVVAAAGNTAGLAVSTPANCPDVIGVGALRHAGTKVGFSDLGLELAISTPGGNCINVTAGAPCLYPIVTASNSGRTTPLNSIYTDSLNSSLGTSFAAPLVSGTAALVLSAQPAMTPLQVKLLLQSTARPFPTTGGDNGDGSVVPVCTPPRTDAFGAPVSQLQCYCTISTCGAGMLAAGAALIAAQAGIAPIGVQASGIWWDAVDAESGWGINFAHQGETIYATWYTYDATGKAYWLSMTAFKVAGAPETYAGQIIETSGPPFSAIPFDPAQVTRTQVGNGTIRFDDANNGTFAYAVKGISQTKPISRFSFATPPKCTYGAAPDFVHATNYQDIWAVANNAESGWGINFTHQGDTIYATWFTYDTDGSALWLSVTAAKTAPGVYSGELIRTRGPPFFSVPFLGGLVTRTVVGSATLAFADGNAATFSYTVNGVSQIKAIARVLFVPPAGTLCQ